MTNTQRIALLETAHRAMHARLEATVMACRVMVPLMPGTHSIKQMLMTTAYDALNAHMERANFDQEFQQDARLAFDELFASLKSCSTP